MRYVYRNPLARFAFILLAAAGCTNAVPVTNTDLLGSSTPGSGPTLTITSGNNAATNSAVPLTYTFTCTPNSTTKAPCSTNVNDYQCSCDNGATYGTCDFTTSHSCAAPSAGTSLTAGFKVKAVDSLQRTSLEVSQGSFLWDLSAPSLTITSANPGDNNAATLTFSWSCDDGTGAGCGTNASDYVCTCPGQAAAACSSPNSHTCALSAGVALSNTTFSVVGSDTVGNVSASASQTFNWDRQAPTVTISSANPGTTNAASLTFTWTCSDSTGVGCSATASDYTCTCPGGTAGACSGATSHTCTLGANNALMSTAFSVQAKDSVGNSSSTASQTFNWDRKLPTLSFTDAGPTVNTDDPKYYIGWSASDADSGLGSPVTYSIEIHNNGTCSSLASTTSTTSTSFRATVASVTSIKVSVTDLAGNTQSACSPAYNRNPVIPYRTIASGYHHSCVVNSSGGASCWGVNTVGQLGDGTTTDRKSAVVVSGLASGVKAVATGDSHSCALLTSGSVKCWGANSLGQLGDGTTTNRLTPVTVSGISTATSITAGYGFTCALLSGGGVSCWGSGSAGQLGNNTFTAIQSTPVTTGLSGVTQISASYDGYHICAVLSTSNVSCWGYNNNGQLGDGTTTNRSVPTAVSGLTGARKIVAGSYFTCAIKADGTAACWGQNGSYQFGNGTTTNSLTPVAVSTIDDANDGISNGLDVCVARVTGVPIQCWGGNGATMGSGSSLSTPTTPASLTGYLSPIELAMGNDYTCTKLSPTSVKCWGDNSFGQLGNGNATDYTVPTVLSLSVTTIEAGYEHTCAADASGNTKCWGWNIFGQIGDTTTTTRYLPVSVSGSFASFAGGYYHTCAINLGGSIYCWGYNGSGQFATGNTVSYYSPTLSSIAAGTMNKLVAGYAHTCGLRTDGTMRCWGINNYGQLGIGNTTNQTSPVDPGLTGLIDIAAGEDHTCALTSAGAAYCWGYNYSGQLGNANNTDQYTPVAVSGGFTYSKIFAGDNVTCGIVAGTGGLKCWGLNIYGGLGDNTTTSRNTPVDVVGLTSVTNVTVGSYHTCAVTSVPSVTCWGWNAHGQLGDGTHNNRLVPTPVVGLSTATAITSGIYHTCAISGGSTYCWGDNSNGQIGVSASDANVTPTTTPGFSI